MKNKLRRLRKPPPQRNRHQRNVPEVRDPLPCVYIQGQFLLILQVSLLASTFFVPTFGTTASVSSVESKVTSAQTAPPFEVYRNSKDSQQDQDQIGARDWEFSERGHVKPPEGVQGRLKLNYHYWKYELKASEFVLDVIDSGYKIPFVFNPPPFSARNNKSSLSHPDFVESAILELLRKRCVIEIDHIPYCCKPLTVAHGKKLRLVLDLRHPN